MDKENVRFTQTHTHTEEYYSAIKRIKSCHKAETPVLWPPHVKSWLIGKDSDAGRDWGQEEKGTTEDEMAGWHHWPDRRESEWTLGVGDGQGGLACCDSWCHKESDTTEWLNWTDWFTNTGMDPEGTLVGKVRKRKVQFSSVTQLCLICNPTDCTMLPCPSPTPGAYSNSCPLRQWCHPTISSSVIPFFSHLQYFPASGSFQMSQLFALGDQILEYRLQHQSFQYSGLISFRMDWLDLLAVQGTLKSLLQHHSSKASLLWPSGFFIVQLSWKNRLVPNTSRLYIVTLLI